jgi:hypothetical protein
MFTNSLNNKGEIMDKEDKRKMEEYKKNPMANFADSVNCSQIGDLSQLTKGSLLTRIITSVIVIGILSLVFFAINNLTSTENKLPSTKPKDFNFVFSYGVGSKNQLDTIKGQYTKDMVTEPSLSTNLKLSDENMDNIYSEIRKINILGYPDSFNPKNNVTRNPYHTYNFKIIVDGVEKNISWVDENVSQSKEAVQLRELFEKIQEIIEGKEEYKKLPEAKGGYD